MTPRPMAIGHTTVTGPSILAARGQYYVVRRGAVEGCDAQVWLDEGHAVGARREAHHAQHHWRQGGVARVRHEGVAPVVQVVHTADLPRMLPPL